MLSNILGQAMRILSPSLYTLSSQSLITLIKQVTIHHFPIHTGLASVSLHAGYVQQPYIPSSVCKLGYGTSGNNYRISFIKCDTQPLVYYVVILVDISSGLNPRQNIRSKE